MRRGATIFRLLCTGYLGLLATAWLPPGTAAPDAPPEAHVIEFQDPWTRGVGAAELLRAAGFAITPVRIAAASHAFTGEVVVVGSFASEHPGYREFMATNTKALLAFVARGGVLLQLTQADQTELEPPFLPPTIQVGRCDDDYDTLRAIVADHPLLEGLVTPQGTVEIPRHLGRAPSWESLLRPFGCRPVLVSDAAGRRPALLEAIHGKGRVLLTSLFLDKVSFPHEVNDGGPRGDPAGTERPTPQTPPAFRRAAEQLFQNLRRYVAHVAAGTAPPVPAAPPSSGRPSMLAWRLPEGGAARYQARRWASLGGREQRRPEQHLLVLPSQIAADGAYQPATSALPSDLATCIALSLPRANSTDEASVSFLVQMDGAGEIRIQGSLRASSAEGGIEHVEGQYAFATTGADPRPGAPRVTDGRAQVVMSFDPTAGVVRASFGRIECELRSGTGKEAMRPALVEHFELDLVGSRDGHAATFAADVNAAIDRGVSHLRQAQLPDGSYAPLPGWPIGSTALSVLALASCDVPLTDPAIERALAWLIAQQPRRTYELSMCLMALDRAYTPAAEVAHPDLVKDGAGIRNLPPERRAWCVGLTERLAQVAHTPGSWAYPAGYDSTVKMDGSNTQYGVLGMRAAGRLGIPVPAATWLDVIRTFEQLRETKAPKAWLELLREGTPLDAPLRVTVPSAAGFRYSTYEPTAWASMACAAIASLTLARHALRAAESPQLTRQREAQIEAMVLGAWAWLDRTWALDRHPHKAGHDWYAYWLYSLERAATLDRVRRIGGRDWYVEGAHHLLARQAGDGSWSEQGGNRTTGTCFALLFLRRATVAPVLTPSAGR